MSAYVYAQDRGKYHAPRLPAAPEEVRPFAWRLRTECGQQFEEARRTFTGYAATEVLCRHCFPVNHFSWGSAS